MIAGKLTVLLENHPELGEIFVVRANNNTGFVFEVEGEQLKLRISKQTAALLCEFIDEVFDEVFDEEKKVEGNV